jgi:hypothetical protein
VIRDVSRALIHQTRQARAAEAAAGAGAAQDAPGSGGRDQEGDAAEEKGMIATNDAAKGVNGPAKSGAANGAAPKQPVGVGVEAGSFLSLLMQPRPRAGGGRGELMLSDDVIMAQSNTFILAGYEVGFMGLRAGGGVGWSGVGWVGPRHSGCSNR